MEAHGASDAEARHNENSSPLEAAPGLVRIAAAAWVRTANLTLSTAVKSTRWIGRAAVSGENPARVLEEASSELRGGLRRLLGLESAPPDEDIARAARESDDRPTGQGPRNPPDTSLREQGAALLRRSAGVGTDNGAHPAYARILEAIAPDEARILRLLVADGAQPAVDVRTWRPLGIGSELVAPGRSLLGREAGCREPERVPMYLNNLFRLGLIWFSREPIQDMGRYQVLEAQPDVVEAMKKAGRGTTVRRSIRLTPFGEDFCQTVLPLDTAEFEAVRAQSEPARRTTRRGDEPPESGSGDSLPATESPSESPERF
jgi:abortive infection alpha-like protein